MFMVLITCSFSWAGGTSKVLPKYWQFYQTNDANLHYSDVKESKWQPVDASKVLRTNPKNGIYGWYLINFDIDDVHNTDDEINDQVSLFISRIRHADETWINGKQIGGVGKIEKPWELIGNNPKNMPRKYPVPRNLLKNENNLLAIKVSLGFANSWGAMQPGSVGLNAKSIFFANKADVDAYYQKTVLQDVIFDTCLILLSLVNMFIIIFLFRRSIHNFREFGWLFVDSVVLLGSIFLLDITNVLKISIPYSGYLLMLSIFLTPLVVAMYFWSMYQNIPKKQVTVIFCLVLFCSLSMFLPIFSEGQKHVLWISWCIFHAFLLLYSLLSAVIGVKNKMIGARAQLFGMVIFIFSIRTQWLPTDLFTHRNVVIGSLIMRYAFLFSYFQRINQMSYDYKRLSQHLLSTIEQHKQNIARDLHDDLGQRLSAIKLRMLLLSGDNKQASMNYIKDEVDATMGAVRELMQGLHPFVLEEHGFATALKVESQRIAKLYNVDISLQAEDIELDFENKKHLFRIFQETVNNAIKHGQAKHIQVKLYMKKQRLFFTVVDDGVGFSVNVNDSHIAGRGFGLISLKERVAILDGHLFITSQLNQGCKVKIWLPISSTSH